MAEKGQWSIVNPSGEEITFPSREELRKAVLDDDIEPQAESIPPDPPAEHGPSRSEGPPARISHPVDEGEAELVAERLSDPEVMLTSANASQKIVLPPVLPEGADDIEAAPPSLGDMMADEPTLQF